VLFSLKMPLTFFTLFFGLLALMDFSYLKSSTGLCLVLFLLFIDFSISWVLNHWESFKKVFLRPWVYLLIFSPIIIAMYSCLYFQIFNIFQMGFRGSWLSTQSIVQYYWASAVASSVFIFLIFCLTYLLIWLFSFIVLSVVALMVVVMQRILDMGFSLSSKL